MTEHPAQSIFDRLWRHTVSLFAIDENESLPDAPGAYSGTGTLVRSDGRSFVLTAAHVWEPIRERKYVGLALQWTGGKGLSIPCDYVSARMTKRRSDEWGPDLAFLQIPEIDARLIEGRNKVFYDLQRNRPVDAHNYLAIVGAPEENVVTEATQYLMPNGIFATPHGRSFERDGFDYVVGARRELRFSDWRVRDKSSSAPQARPA